ncbi:MAG: hypothetical protein WBD99_07915 [Thermodesulfobacteriota bacterium]
MRKVSKTIQEIAGKRKNKLKQWSIVDPFAYIGNLLTACHSPISYWESA